MVWEHWFALLLHHLRSALPLLSECVSADGIMEKLKSFDAAVTIVS